MKAYTNMKNLSEIRLPGYEFEILNELKDLKNHTDNNCLHRNRYLFEFDDKSLKEQWNILLPLCEQGIINRIVYSGSKSFHTIIQTDFDAPDQIWYKSIWKYLYNQYFTGADQACSNPARLTRTPNVIRKDTNKKQELLYNKGNIFHLDKNILEKIRSEIEFNKMKNLVNKTLTEPKQNNIINNGLCFNYDVIQQYLNTPFTKLKGNLYSSEYLFKAIRCCIKYNDKQTLDLVLNKARLEHWSEKEINHIINNIEKYI